MLRFVIIFIALFAILLLLLWYYQERVVFQPPGGPWPGAGETRRVDYAAADGQRLFGYVVTPPAAGSARTAPPASAGERVLIAFHGNADLAGWQIPWADEVARTTGWTVFLAEYRGYAGLDGSPTYLSSQLDAQAAWGVVRDTLGVAAHRIALFGHSLGSAVATELAAHVASSSDAGPVPAALILQSPFTSARAMARIAMARPLSAFWGVIARVHFDTEHRVRELETPVWVTHGERDVVIPVRMGRAVHEAARTSRELLIVEGAGHNDVPQAGGDRYWRFLATALRQAAPTGGTAAPDTAPSARRGAE